MGGSYPDNLSDNQLEGLPSHELSRAFYNHENTIIQHLARRLGGLSHLAILQEEIEEGHRESELTQKRLSEGEEELDIARKGILKKERELSGRERDFNRREKNLHRLVVKETLKFINKHKARDQLKKGTA